jgi:hypothetical protein
MKSRRSSKLAASTSPTPDAVADLPKICHRACRPVVASDVSEVDREPAVGFEPTTYRLQVGCATGLRHAGDVPSLPSAERRTA